MAPSFIAYDTATEECLIGQEALESSYVKNVFGDLQFAVVTGKLVNRLAGRRLLSSRDMAKDYLAAILRRAGEVLGLNGEAMVAFTVPLAACRNQHTWRRFHQWLTIALNQAGFTRMELIEQPWAAAWGAGMKIKPEDRFIIFSISEEYLEAAMVQVINQAGYDGSRHIRVLSYSLSWLTEEEPAAQLTQVLKESVRQVLREAEPLGYTADSLAGVVVIGSNVSAEVLTTIRELFAGITVYDGDPLAAAACGAALLSSGVDGCGYLQHDYSVRYLAADGCRYREIVSKGMFYPSEGTVNELTIKASYNGQKDFALLLYRDEEQCINEDNPLLLVSDSPANKGQPIVTVGVSLDGAGQLVVTARDAVSNVIILENRVAAKLV